MQRNGKAVTLARFFLKTKFCLFITLERLTSFEPVLNALRQVHIFNLHAP